MEESTIPASRAASRAGTRGVPREVREPQMLDAATELFAQRGYGGVSMDAIAERAGITKPMLYSYFGSKEGLLGACVARVNVGLREYLEERVEAIDDPELRLWTGIRSLFGWIEANREGWALYRHALAAGVSALAKEVERARADMVDTIRSLFEESAFGHGIGENLGAEVDAMAEAFVAAHVALANRWLDHPEESADHQALRAMNFFWNGLGGMIDQRLWLPPPPDSGAKPGP